MSSEAAGSNTKMRSRSRSESPTPRDRSSSRSRSATRSRSRSPKRNSAKDSSGNNRKRSRSRSVSSSHSESSSDSGSESEDSSASEAESQAKPKKGKDKKEKKKKKDKSREKKSKKDKERKKQDKKKKKHKKKKEKRSSTMAEEDKPYWGKYGVLKPVDIYNKAPEFHAWLSEHKKISRDLLSSKEEKEYFEEFREDYNTATLPDKKFYNLEAWEKWQRDHNPNWGTAEDDEPVNLTDEERLRLERQNAKASAEQQREKERIMAMKRLLQDADPNRKKELMNNYLIESSVPATFESIAQKRKDEKAAREKAARKEYLY